MDARALWLEDTSLPDLLAMYPLLAPFRRA
jgi:hypothetical protein